MIDKITEPHEWIDSLVSEYAPNSLDVDVALQNMGLKIQNMTKTALDNQEGGDHYKKLGDYQPWQVLAKWMTPEELKGAMKKEVITYLCREADKGGFLDIKKAAHTLQIYLELVGNDKIS